MTEHSLPAERLHFAWDNSLEPTLEIESGDGQHHAAPLFGCT
jgi:hypothetical protein